MLMLAMLVNDLYCMNFDLERVFRISLIHDLGEIDTGDLTPDHGIAKEEKSRLERQSVERIFRNLPTKDRYLELWDDYENQVSLEASFVREIDKLEMALQASIYEVLNLGNLSVFFESAGEVVEHPELKKILDEIKP
jgi:putative hydrolase of HD superfamily